MFEFVIIQEKIHKRREEKLKEDLKRIIVEADSLLVKLEMIDNIMKLGLESQFGKEIKEGLDTMALLINHNNQLFCDDLYATALCFRLLRQRGCQVSQGSTYLLMLLVFAFILYLWRY